ncbi:hypothetical protein [Saccharibacillus alkalitolerans]|uniref:Uncharacterized protein n=1 Tax=Saccharibacillus alkalitolerans TaxID=2705290 RepID=A0ABX0FCE3_9BACL|nr:hypothetical protein [Saccharibacillus alkalitolerans]NGZ76961.1 hypothetical protein [Saccharibacillus alkalitolerans]
MFCCSMFVTPIASWPLIIGVSIAFCLLWRKVKDVLISTALLMAAVFPLALWFVSFSNPVSAMNLRAWMIVLYIGYAFLFMMPQLGLTAVFRSLREEKKNARGA